MIQFRDNQAEILYINNETGFKAVQQQGSVLLF
jgi:hypothetical protein